jgi:alginate O-acetyltransferase complex protein AlgI
MKTDPLPFRACLLADWRDALFVHYAIDPAILQRHVPLELDLFEGHAWVTLVAFTQVDLRPALGGRLTAWTMRPVATHAFLNLRTYVRCPGCRAIYFLAEWIPNRLAQLVGPRLYGLPFRLAHLDYPPERRQVWANDGTLCLHVSPATNPGVSSIEGTRDDFLVERYAAFTCRNGRVRRFDIRHSPWKLAPANVVIESDDLVRQAAPWFAGARYVCSHFSEGVRNVEMSAPRSTTGAEPKSRLAWAAALAPLALSAIALALRHRMPAWAFMWTFAFGLFFGCKLATWMMALPHAGGWRRSLAYLFAWPGMDARAFYTGVPPATRAFADVFAAGLRALVGLLLFFVIAPVVPSGHPLLVGWLGLVGMILLLHFGLFDLLAFAWQATGRRALPIMRAPWRARTLGEFWGTRWNRGFRDLAHTCVFTPLLKPLDVTGATLAVFLVSGLIHDLIISLPARAGFGGPTVYFVLQALGLFVERSSLGRRFLRGGAGRLFTLTCVGAPLPMLFHPFFMTRVMVPFMRAIGCI